LGIFVSISGDELSFYTKSDLDQVKPSRVSFERRKSDLSFSGVRFIFDNVDLNTISYPYSVENFYLYYNIPDPKNYSISGWYSNYLVDADLDNTTLILTGYKNKVLTGNFSGTLYDRPRNRPPIDANTPNITIAQGTFAVNFKLQ